MSGAKTSLQSYQVKTIAVPHYKGLAIKDILDFVLGDAAVQNALPSPKECLRLERAYICNVAYSIIGEPFRNWVEKQVNERNEKIAVEGNQYINMDPEIARIFQASTQVSTTNGTSCFLMKPSAKKRRSKAEIKADRAAQKDADKERREAAEMMQQMAASWEQEKKNFVDQMAQMQTQLNNAA